MKHLALLFSLTLMIVHLHSIAQDFAPVGAIWHYTERFAFTGGIDYLTVQSVKDTLIHGIPSRRLDCERLCWTPSGKQFIHYANDSLYRFHPDFDTFQLIAAFNAKKYDAWKFLIKDWDESIDTIRVEVDSINQVTINNKLLRQLYVTYYVINYDVSGLKQRDYSYSSRIVEKIGDMAYLFNFPISASLVCDDNYSDGLRCYEDAEFGFYSTGIADSCTYRHGGLGVKDDAIMQDVEIFPNPTHGMLNIILPSQKDITVQVKDLAGRSMLFETLNTNGQIDLSGLSNGLYILFVSDKDKTIGHSKVIKK